MAAKRRQSESARRITLPCYADYKTWQTTEALTETASPSLHVTRTRRPCKGSPVPAAPVPSPASPRGAPGLSGRTGAEGRSRGDSEETRPTPGLSRARAGQAAPALCPTAAEELFGAWRAHPERSSLRFRLQQVLTPDCSNQSLYTGFTSASPFSSLE